MFGWIWWWWLEEQRRRWWWPQQETAKTLHASQTRLGTKEIYKCTKMAIAMVIQWVYILTTTGECKFFLPAFFLAPWPQDDCMLWNSSFYCSWTRIEKVLCHVSLHQSKIFSYEILWKSRRKWNFKISHFWKLCTIGRMAFCDVEQLRQQSNHSTLCYNINARHQMWLFFNILMSFISNLFY